MSQSQWVQCYQILDPNPSHKKDITLIKLKEKRKRKKKKRHYNQDPSCRRYLFLYSSHSFQLTLRSRVNWISAPFLNLCAIYLHHGCFVKAKIYLVQLEGSNQVSITLHCWPKPNGCLNCYLNSSNSGWATRYNLYITKS